ncbi:MAG: metallophosphoesterase, partial [Acidimicrobiia bacterium]|nr:metallophosphoesterase [Acidimicrobiia bacterium]
RRGRSRGRARRGLLALALLAAALIVAAPDAPADSSAPAAVEVRVGVGGDDVEERADGSLSAGSSDLELTEDGGRQTVGVRFRGVGVPAGARIVAAWVQFTVDESSSTATTLQIRGVAEGNPAAFAGRYGVTLRPLTSAAVAWSPAAWNTVGAAGADQRTPDLAAILQSLVDRPDWSAGNSVALVFSGSGKRVAEAYEGSRSAAPLLHIDYQAGSGPVNQPPQVTAAAVPALITAPGSITLDGTISDDGLPNPPATVTVTWAQIQGPATATINNPNTPDTTAYLPQPGTYTFQLTATDGQATTQTTTTATATSGTGSPTIRFAAFGDYGVGNAAEAAVASLVASLGVDFIVTAGDNIQWPGTYDRLVGAYYSAFIGAYRGAYGPGSPSNRFFPALGNHDYTDGGAGSAYFDYFTLPGASFVSTSGTERYYDFVWGPVQFFILDGYTQTEVQRSWLEGGLATSATPWQIVVVHFPPFSSAGSSDWMQWPYEAWGADAVLSGHAHVYERVMRDDDGNGAPMPYLVIGLGGGDISSFGIPVAGSAARYNAGHGTLVVEACDAGMTLAFHSVSHGVVDQHRVGASCPPRG